MTIKLRCQKAFVQNNNYQILVITTVEPTAGHMQSFIFQSKV